MRLSARGEVLFCDEQSVCVEPFPIESHLRSVCRSVTAQAPTNDPLLNAIGGGEVSASDGGHADVTAEMETGSAAGSP